jgi:hypothetical protein
VITQAAGYQFDYSTIGYSGTGHSVGEKWPLNADFELCAVNDSDWYWFGTYSDIYGNRLVVTRSGGLNDLWFVNVYTGWLIGSVLRLPWPRDPGTLFCAVTDQAGQLWLITEIEVQNGNASCLALTGPNTAIQNGVDVVAALLQAGTWTAPQQRLYTVAGNTAAGPNPALWMLVRANVFARPSDSAAWSGWMPLGGEYLALVNGPPFTATDTLFAVDAELPNSLNAISQNPTTGVWKSGDVQRPSHTTDDTVTLPMYQTEVTIYDSNGIPEANVPVTIFAETPVEAWVNEVVYPLGPVQGITVPTNNRGKLRIKSVANRIHAAQLTFQADGLNGAEVARRGRFGVAVAARLRLPARNRNAAGERRSCDQTDADRSQCEEDGTRPRP